MNCIHKNDYKISDALAELVPDQGPVLCRDEMEEWSPSEASLFEEALEKYGKDFRDIQQDFVSCTFNLELFISRLKIRVQKWHDITALNTSSMKGQVVQTCFKVS